MSITAEKVTDNLIRVTENAVNELIRMRDEETDKEKLGLRIEVILQENQEFGYDLSFQEFLKTAYTDRVWTINGLKVMVPLNSVDRIEGATVDYNTQQGLIVRNPNKPQRAPLEGLVNDDELSERIKLVIKNEVNPALDAHGGYVTFAGHNTQGIVYMTMGGGCHGCSLSALTMLEGVHETLKKQIPELVKVCDVTDHTLGTNPYA